MFVVVGGSLRVLLLCVCAGAFVRAYLMLTLICTVGSHFSLIFFFFQECACAKSLIVRNQELDVTFPVPGVR